MSQIIHEDARYFLVEAYSSDGGPSAWRLVSDNAVKGYERWHDHQARVKQTARGQFMTGVLAFSDLSVVSEMWDHLHSIEQKYPLRIVWVQETVTKLVMFSSSQEGGQ